MGYIFSPESCTICIFLLLCFRLYACVHNDNKQMNELKGKWNNIAKGRCVISFWNGYVYAYHLKEYRDANLSVVFFFLRTSLSIQWIDSFEAVFESMDFFFNWILKNTIFLGKRMSLILHYFFFSHQMSIIKDSVELKCKYANMYLIE